MEVAGLVLGALPVAISALKGYRSILSSLKTVKRDIDYLIRDLGTEQQILQNTCETLLKGIVPDSKLDEMIDDPFGPDWKQYDDQIRLRLWRSHDTFQERLAEMHDASVKLKEMLAIQEDGKTKLTDGRSILSELKHRTGFTLKKKDYETIMTRIKDGNSVLLKLAQQNNELELNRRSRSQAKVARLIRKLSQSIFDALRIAMTCSCATLHNVGLELIPRKTVIIHGEPEDTVARTLSFHIVVGSIGGSTPQSQRWDSLRIKLADKHEPSFTTAPSPMRDAIDTQLQTSRTVRWTSNLTSSFKSRKDGVAISGTSATQTLLHVSTAIPILPATSTYTPPTVTNLCQLMRGKSPASDCCGLITNAAHNFELYPQACHSSESRSFITLRQILEDCESGSNITHHFGYPEQLRLALALSVSVLHLYNTPWLARIVTLDDVAFLRESSHQSYDNPYQPFVTKDFSTNTTSTTNQNRQQHQANHSLPGRLRPMDLTVMSLGTLLIQIILGKRIPDLDLTPEPQKMDMNSVLARKEAASQLTGPIVQNGGMNYDSAVQWCLGSILGVASLEDDNFCQNFYEGVVARLEADRVLLGL